MRDKHKQISFINSKLLGLSIAAFFITSCTATSNVPLIEEDLASSIQAKVVSPSELVFSHPILEKEADNEPSDPHPEEKNAEKSLQPVDEPVQPKPTSADEPSENVKDARPSVAQQAYQQVRSLLDNSADASESLVFSEGVSESAKSVLENYLSSAFSMFDDQYGIIDPYTAIIFSYSDAEWADAKMSQFNANIPADSWAAWANQLGHSEENCWLGSAQRSSFFMCIASDPSVLERQSITIAHEYVHSIQSVIGLDHKNMPIWVKEGSAEYFGSIASGYESGYTLSKASSWQTQYLSETFRGRGFRDYVVNMSSEDFSFMMNELEAGATAESAYLGDKYGVYYIGSVATEYLIGTYSYQRFMSFLEDTGTGMPWEHSFSKNFGVDKESFYNQLQDYMIESYR